MTKERRKVQEPAVNKYLEPLEGAVPNGNPS